MSRINDIVDRLWERLDLPSTSTTPPLPPTPPPPSYEQRQNQRRNNGSDEENVEMEEEENVELSRSERERREEGEEEEERGNRLENDDDMRSFGIGATVGGPYNVTDNVDIRRHYNNFLTAYSISPIYPHLSYPIEIKGLLRKAYQYIERHLQIEQSLKVHVTMLVSFLKENGDEDDEDRQQSQHFCLRTQTISLDDSISDLLAQFENKFGELIAAYEARGSGYVFEKIIHLDLILIKYHPIEAGCHTPLPKYLEKKKIWGFNQCKNASS